MSTEASSLLDAAPAPAPRSLHVSEAEEAWRLANSGPLSRKHSLEYFSPAPYSISRQASLNGAVRSLTATILGGGILSLPFCFALCGFIGGGLFLGLIAAASNFSVYILISCSRRVRHGASYEEVVRTAFGVRAGRAVSASLLALIFLVIVAYLLLIRDLLSPLLELALGLASPLGVGARFLLVAAVLAAMMPLCLQRSLSALAWLSMACIVPMAVLAVVLLWRGGQQAILAYREPWLAQFQDGGLKLFPSSAGDALYALPILACAFMCHFNVLPLHRELIRPTRPRIKKMINRVTALCSTLYGLVGIGGYLAARNHTDGNVLNNFSRDDPLAVIARMSLAFTCIAGIPFIVLPTRHVLGKLLLVAWPHLADAETLPVTAPATPTPAASAPAPTTAAAALGDDSAAAQVHMCSWADSFLA